MNSLRSVMSALMLAGVWGVSAGEPSASLAWEARLDAFQGGLAFSPDGRTLACGDARGRIRLFEAATGKALRSWQAHPAAVLSVSFSPDGRRLASGAAAAAVPGGKACRIWDLADPASGEAPPASESFDAPEAVKGVTLAFSPDGKLLAGGSPMAAFVWDCGQKRLAAQFPLEGKCFVPARVSWFPDGTGLLFPRYDNQILVFKSDGAPAGSVAIESRSKDALALPGGTVVWAGNENRIQAVDPASGAILRHLWRDEEAIERQSKVGAPPGMANSPALFTSAKQASVLALSRDGLTLAAGGTDRVVWVWDLPEAKLALSEDLGQGVAAVAVSPEGRRIAAVGAAGAVRVWEAAAPAEDAAALRDEVARIHARKDAQESACRDLVARLGDAELASREEAEAGLRERVYWTASPLRTVLEDPESAADAEVRERAARLLARAEGPLDVPDADLRRMYQVVRLLERIGTPEAARLLEEIARSSPSPRVRENAGHALARLGGAAR